MIEHGMSAEGGHLGSHGSHEEKVRNRNLDELAYLRDRPHRRYPEWYLSVLALVT